MANMLGTSVDRDPVKDGNLLTQVTSSSEGPVFRHSCVQELKDVTRPLPLSECLFFSSLPWLLSFSSSCGLWKLQAHGELAEKGFRVWLKSSSATFWLCGPGKAA